MFLLFIDAIYFLTVASLQEPLPPLFNLRYERIRIANDVVSGGDWGHLGGGLND
jgi:hypothetical protein